MQVPYRKPPHFASQPPDPRITQKKYQELERELQKLKAIHPGAAAEVSRLAELGDFSENAEYQLAKGRLRGINNAIFKLEKQLHQAEVIPATTNHDTVQLGSTVTVNAGGEQKIYQLLGSVEANPSKGIISDQSPLGSLLIGKRAGETFVRTIAGREVVYTIVAIA